MPKRHRDKLGRLLRGGIQQVRVVLRALALSQLHQGKSASEVAANLQFTPKAVREIGVATRTLGWTGRCMTSSAPGQPFGWTRVSPIHLVMDNLSSHSQRALADRFREEEGRALWDRLHPCTWKWLNQAELEIGLFAKQCLGQRRITNNSAASLYCRNLKYRRSIYGWRNNLA